MPFYVDGTKLKKVTLDGTNVKKVTLDGTTVFQYDVTPPTILINSPGGGTSYGSPISTSDTNITFSGRVYDNDSAVTSLTCNGSKLGFNSSGYFSKNVGLSTSISEFRFEALDECGNKRTVSRYARHLSCGFCPGGEAGYVAGAWITDDTGYTWAVYYRCTSGHIIGPFTGHKMVIFGWPVAWVIINGVEYGWGDTTWITHIA